MPESGLRYQPRRSMGYASAASRHLVALASESAFHHYDALNKQIYLFDRSKQLPLLVRRLRRPYGCRQPPEGIRLVWILLRRRRAMGARCTLPLLKVRKDCPAGIEM